MEWRTTYHNESTDGKTEHITCEIVGNNKTKINNLDVYE